MPFMNVLLLTIVYAILVFVGCFSVFLCLIICRMYFSDKSVQKKVVGLVLVLIGVMLLISGLEKTWFRIKYDKPLSIGLEDLFRSRDSPRHVEVKKVRVDLLDTVFNTQYKKLNITKAWFVIRSDSETETEFQEIVLTEDRIDLLESLKALVERISSLQSADKLSGIRWVDLDSKWEFGSNSENHGLSRFEILDESQIPIEVEMVRYVDCDVSGVVLRGIHAKQLVKSSSWDVLSDLRIRGKFVVVQNGGGPSVVVCATHSTVGFFLIIFSGSFSSFLLYVSRRIVDDTRI